MTTPLPASADPARIQERVSPVAPETVNEQAIVPSIVQQNLTPPPEPAKGFVLRRVMIKGAYAVPPDRLALIYRPLIGRRADLATAAYIAARVTALYRERGYFLSRAVVPVQDVKDGSIEIAVIEGYVARVRFAGPGAAGLLASDRLGLLQGLTARIEAMRPLRASSLERALLIVNDFPGFKAQAVLTKLPEQEAAPGAVGLIVQLERKPPDFSVSYDNYGSRFTGPGEVSLSAGFGNILTAGDRGTFSTLLTTRIREAKANIGNYTTPLNTKGLSLSANGGYSTVIPGFTLRPLDVRSKSYNGGAQLSQILVRTRRTTASVAAGFDAADNSTDFLGNVLYRDRIRALRISGLLDYTDDWHGINTGGFILSQGLDLFGASRTGSANLSRANGHSDFTKILASLSRLQQLTPFWQFYGGASGQYAFNPLLASEEFGYGGSAFGRAYDPSEITGDDGLAGALELRFNGIPEWRRTVVQPFTFYDIGKVWKNNGGGSGTIMSGASAGGGFRFFSLDTVSGAVTIAVPLTRSVITPQAYTSENGPRLLLQLGARF